MGISLNLVIYNQSNDKLIEENMKTIRCAEIPQSLLEAITKEFPLKEIPVYYDGKSDKNYIIECFDNNDIDSIINKLKECFKFLIYRENQRGKKGTCK